MPLAFYLMIFNTIYLIDHSSANKKTEKINFINILSTIFLLEKK